MRAVALGRLQMRRWLPLWWSAHWICSKRYLMPQTRSQRPRWTVLLGMGNEKWAPKGRVNLSQGRVWKGRVLVWRSMHRSMSQRSATRCRDLQFLLLVVGMRLGLLNLEGAKVREGVVGEVGTLVQEGVMLCLLWWILRCRSGCRRRSRC